MAEAARACSNRRRTLIGSWVTQPTTSVIEIERRGDENITINHGCSGGDCGGGSNSGGGDAATAAMAATAATAMTAATAEAEKSMVVLAAAGPTTAVTAEAKATTSRQ